MTTMDRPRERLLALGADRVSDVELLSVVLGTGNRGKAVEALAADVLREAGGLLELSRASPKELVAIAGLGPVRALRVAAAFHLGRRAGDIVRASDVRLVTARDVYRRLRGRVHGLSQEVFLVVGLDARHGVIEEVEVARGTLTGVEVHPREVFRPLIRMAAAAAVVAHNHPSGDPRPSQDDLDLTRRLREVGQTVGIPIADHIVIGAAGFTSINDVLGWEG